MTNEVNSSNGSWEHQGNKLYPAYLFYPFIDYCHSDLKNSHFRKNNSLFQRH